jgi:hypothetical protein
MNWVVLPVVGVVLSMMGLIVITGLLELIGPLPQRESTSTSSKLFLGAFGLMMLFFGLHALSYPWLLRRKLGQTRYVVTNLRAVVLESTLMGKIRFFEFAPERLVSMTIERNTNDPTRGDIIFEQFEEAAGSGTITIRRGFLDVSPLSEAERALRSLMAQR